MPIAAMASKPATLEVVQAGSVEAVTAEKTRE